MRYTLLLLTCLVCVVLGCETLSPVSQPTRPPHCRAYQGLPDLSCTPGAIFANATVQQICTPGYSHSVRNVPYSEKLQAYQAYGITHHRPGEFEIDHLISLELGGSNDLTNLWPEAAQPVPGFHEKDSVENYLHAQVCSGQMALKDAQHAIATNWQQFLDDISTSIVSIAHKKG